MPNIVVNRAVGDSLVNQLKTRFRVISPRANGEQRIHATDFTAHGYPIFRTPAFQAGRGELTNAASAYCFICQRDK